ncbi:NAD(P)H-dependent oxidoreductase [Minwuia thermotolerans]|uniref:Flagellar biosynthesis protein FlgA n=1 Tax=Minwuia thermotolerans TaxID=2056226 RepID=A0A2M9G7K8_9PROT|nr:SAF domain-containing protein [Minwuia thermotolerans]PJK31683.1 flagellar biosynthesis protein FlgA [Minwuia thermotolerans]
MNLYRLLQEAEAKGRPVRVGLIGAGKFGSMFLAQCRRTPGMHLLGVVDLAEGRAAESCRTTGWPDERIDAKDPADALKTGKTWCGQDAMKLIEADALDVVIDATGHPAAGIQHALAAFRNRRHVVMVNVEADVLAGPLLARRAAEAGVVCSMAYGDQPALISEQVDWARAIGLEVVCAGKGTKYRPVYHRSTPDTVWDYYGLTAEHAAASGMNPQMFNSFLDGTKSAIEMAAVANACGLTPQSHGLSFPPAAVEELCSILRPHNLGGVLEHEGTVEVVSCETRDGAPVPNDLRWGTYVTFKAPDDYVRRCFSDYGLVVDDTGDYAALWRPYHLIGLELGISVASVALRGEPTGATGEFRGDVAATAKRPLKAGEMLDGEGGYTVYGRLMRADESLKAGVLPLGLAHGVKLKRDIAEDAAVTWDDVEFDAADPTVAFRREMEAAFRN